MDHMLKDLDIPGIEIFRVYRHGVCNSGFSNQASILWSDSVAMVWWDIAETHLLEGRREPRNPTRLHSQELYKPLTCMFCHFAYQDPTPQREKVVLLGLAMSATLASNPSCNLDLCTTELIHIALFFCLYSCEYT